MTIRDLLYLALIAIALLFEYFVVWRSFLRRSQVDPPRARSWLWSAWLILLWTLTAVGIAVWMFEGRAWAMLRLISPQGWRLWSSVALVLAVTIFGARTIFRIARRSGSRRIKLGNPHVERLSPHTGPELAWWVALSLSAGFCEEFIFRGYLIWAFQLPLGLWVSAALSVIVFALAHCYQGAKGVLATGIVGSFLTLVVLIFGSLWPAIVLHALIDIQQGLLAWLVFRRAEGEGTMVSAVQAK